MNKFLNNLPKLSSEQQRRRNIEGNSTTIRDNFTVKKCPLMDNFENMDPSTTWKPLIGSPIHFDSKKKQANIEAFKELHIENKLPNIHGIYQNKDEKEEDDNEEADEDSVIFTPNRITNIYIGSLSLVGLFILFRVVNKSK
jgi:hypothetical protein